MAVHHIDGQPTNSTLKNLITLCIGCHNWFHQLEVNEGAINQLQKIKNSKKIKLLKARIY